MKKLYKLLSAVCGLWALLFLAWSCDKMDDIQRQYAEKEEQVYLGKVDSLKVFPGIGRAKVTWYIGSDPKIDRTIIYWNMRRDSIVREFKRITPDVQKDSIILEGLVEGTTLFEFRNVNDEGESSLYSSTSVAAWGPEFIKGLRARQMRAFDFDYIQSTYQLALSPTTRGDSVVYAEVVYTDKLGIEKTIRIDRSTDSVRLTNFPDGGEFRFRTAFFPPQGIDTLYNDYQAFEAPSAITERGTKITLMGHTDSKYFDRNGEQVYEWTTGGDVIVYQVAAGGTLTEAHSFPGLVPRSTYRDFFFYDDDKFIGITTGNAVQMLQIINGVLTIVKTPTGADAFGSGFGFPKFIPTRGYFFSIAADKGEMKTWLAQNNATWGAPNGTTVGTGFDVYEPLMLFNHHTLLGVDANGFLWGIPISASGTLGSKSRLGSGWDRFKKIVSIGTGLLCMEANGDFYIFDNFNTTDNFWIVD